MPHYEELREYVERWLEGQVRVVPAPGPFDGSYALQTRIGSSQSGYLLVGFAGSLEEIDALAKTLMPAVMSLAGAAR
jgi:hypothetical protein